MKYEKPEMELIEISKENILTASVDGPDGPIDEIEGGEF